MEKAVVDFVLEDVKGAIGGVAAAGATNLGIGEIKLEYDLVEAVRRQQMFYYQVSAEIVSCTYTSFLIRTNEIVLRLGCP